MSPFLQYGLILLAPLNALGLAYVLALAKDNRKRYFSRLTQLLVGWLALQFILAQLGLYQFTQLPTYLLVALPAYGLAIGYALFSRQRQLRDIPLAYLLIMNALRLPLWLFMGLASSAGLLPEWDYFPLYQFDWLLGLAAMGLYFILPEDESELPKPKRWLLVGFNVLGLASFGSAVVVLGMSVPGLLRVLDTATASTLVLEFPGVWLPALLGPSLLFTHVAMLRKLIQRLLSTLNTD